MLASLSVTGYEKTLAQSRPQEYQQIVAVANFNKFDSRRTARYILRNTLPELCGELFQADVLSALIPELTTRHVNEWRPVEISSSLSPWSWQRPELALPTTHNVMLAKLSSAFILQGLLANDILYQGFGPPYPGTVHQAKEIAQAFCETVLEDHEPVIVMFATDEAWGPWFYDMDSNRTYFWVEPGRDRVWLLCITDTD